MVQSRPSALVADGKLYAIGGRLEGNFARNLAVNEEYDPKADRWRSGRCAAYQPVLGQRTAYLRDPDGHLIELAQDLGQR
jgi:catechol 2,3-dioxygenase-like lactoylglutathione lyase family enzyme